MTLRFVAEYGDACNITGGVTTVRHKLGVLRKHCMAIGRDYGEILKTKLGHLIIARDSQEARSMAEGEGYTSERLNDYVIYGTPDRVKESIRELAASGVEYLILNIHAKKEETMLKFFAEVASSLS